MPHTDREIIPGLRYGEYRVEAPIGEDPAGTIFGAYDESNRRLVSLRVFSQLLTKESGFVDILRIQVQAMSSFQNPGIVSTLGMGKQSGEFYVASEWCPGGSLAQAVAQSGTPDFSVALGIITKCAGILNNLSEKGFFHGNLKPSNMMFHTEAGLKLSDLGLAAAIRATIPPDGLPVYLGSTKFLAPEMSKVGSPDFRADIYSLGVVFYYLIFGVVPFRHQGQRLQDTLSETDVLPSREVVEVLSRMTETNPADRYQNYQELLPSLKELQGFRMPRVEKIPAKKEADPPGIQNQDLLKLLCALYTSGTSGMLKVQGDGTTKSFHIRNREIVFFESSKSEEDIWNWLIKKRELSEQDIPEERENFPVALKLILDRNLIRLEDFRYRYQELLQQSVNEVCRWNQVSASFQDRFWNGEPPGSIPLGDFLMKAARRFSSPTRIKQEVSMDSLMNRTPLFDSLISGLPLSSDESLFVSQSHLDNHVRTVKNATGIPEDRILRFLYILKQIGAVNISPAKPGGWATETTSASSANPDRLTQPVRLGAERVSLGEVPNSPSEHEQDYLQSMRVEVKKPASQGAYREHYANESAKYFHMARSSYEEGNYGSAAHYCERAIGMHEESSYYWLMGLSYSHHPKFRKKAEDCFHRAIDLDPLNDDLHIQLAEFYVDRGLLLRAKSHCIKALEIVPGEIRAKDLYQYIDQEEPGVGGCWCEHAPGCKHTGNEGNHVCKK